MESGARIGRFGELRDTSDKILTPGDEYNQSHAESKWDRQVRTLKQNFGPSSIVALISGALSTVAVVVTILIAVGSPFAKQVELNTASTTEIQGLKAAVKDNKDEQAKALASAVAEIKSLVTQSRDELRMMRESNERQMTELRGDTKALWMWNTRLENQIKAIETENKLRKNREN